MNRSLLALVVCAVVAASPPVFAQQIPCRDKVEGAWNGAGLDRGDIEKIDVVERYRFDAENEYIVGYDIWAHLKSCKGALVVQVTRTCRLEQVYTRGDCRLPNVPSFR